MDKFIAPQPGEFSNSHSAAANEQMELPEEQAFKKLIGKIEEAEREEGMEVVVTALKQQKGAMQDKANKARANFDKQRKQLEKESKPSLERISEDLEAAKKTFCSRIFGTDYQGRLWVAVRDN